MTRIKKLLTALADGAPMSAQALSEATGIPRDRIVRTLGDLRHAGLIEDAPATCRITPAGMAKQVSKPKARPKVPYKPGKPPVQPAPIDVSQSIQGRPALEKAWGAPA